MARSLKKGPYIDARLLEKVLNLRKDEKKIISPKFRLDVAKKISLGVQDWLKQLQ